MYKCKIRYKDIDFRCVEQAYFHDMAEEARDQQAAKKLQECKNGYQAKRIEECIKQHDGWNDKKVSVSAKLHEKNMCKTKI